MEERWRERFGEFASAFARLREALEADNELTALEYDAAIHRFASAFTLACHTLREQLTHEGMYVELAGGRDVIREALDARLIGDRATWFAMLADRNRLAHSYDEDGLDALYARIRTRYLAALSGYHARFAADMVEA